MANVDEEWRPVVGFEGRYEVSNLGRVRDAETKRPRMPYNHKNGYLSSYLAAYSGAPGKTEFIHRLVAKAFIPNPGNLREVHHKDFNRKNNRADNLEWTTSSQNKMYSSRAGRLPGGRHLKGRRSNHAMFSDGEVRRIRWLVVVTGMTQKDVAQLYDVSEATISRVMTSFYYSDVA